MKHYTSKFLKSVALGYSSFFVLYLVLAALLFDVPGASCVRILVSPSHWIVSALALFTGYGLWEMRRWSWYVFMATNVLITYQNAIVVSDYGETHHKALAFTASALLLVALIYRVAREVRVPYFFPKIRWWESNPRYRLSVPMTLVRGSGEELQGDMLDLSMGGCFVKTRADLQQDEPLELRFAVFGIPLACAAHVVWRAESTVTHPKGVGCKFALLPRSEKRTLRQVTRRLRKIAAFYRRSRYIMSQDEFMKRMDELQAPRGESVQHRLSSAHKP